MPPTSPVTPGFPLHQVKMDILRRKAVYHWPPPSTEWIQEKLQKQIAEMRADGYEPEIINRILRTLSQVAMHEANTYACNVSRAVFFAELINLEIQ